jgi:hypothetical protein
MLMAAPKGTQPLGGSRKSIPTKIAAEGTAQALLFLLQAKISMHRS